MYFHITDMFLLILRRKHERFLSFWLSNQWLNRAVFIWNWPWNSKTLAKLCLNQRGNALLFRFSRLLLLWFKSSVTDRNGPCWFQTGAARRDAGELLLFCGLSETQRWDCSFPPRQVRRSSTDDQSHHTIDTETVRNELYCEGSDTSKHRWSPSGSTALGYYTSLFRPVETMRFSTISLTSAYSVRSMVDDYVMMKP